MNKIEIEKTAFQKATEERNNEIRKLVASLRKRYPEASNTRILETVASAYGITRQGVTAILKKYGEQLESRQ